MTTAPTQPDLPAGVAPAGGAGGGLRAWVRLLRLKQWVKGVFVLVGPAYGHVLGEVTGIGAALLAFLAFGLASSACYIVNDIQDHRADAAHPRKRRRPIASGAISPRAGLAASVVCGVLAAGACAGVWVLGRQVGDAWWSASGPLLAGVLLLYVVNTLAYSLWLKHVAILDVMSLSSGFVLRVLAGCAAVMVTPSTWLLNVTLFVAMFLAFGKRLGERRTAGSDPVAARKVQAVYTDALLRMVVVVTGVGALITYAGYVQSRGEHYHFGFNLLWLTMLPASFALFRSMLMLESGEYDDPTELAGSDRPFQLAVVIFAGITAILLAWFGAPPLGTPPQGAAGILAPSGAIGTVPGAPSRAGPVGGVVP